MKNTFVSIIIFILIGFIGPLSQADQLHFLPYIQLANSDEGLENAVQTIKNKTEGRILSAKTVDKNDGSRIYKIKVLLPSGKIKTFHVSAQ